MGYLEKITTIHVTYWISDSCLIHSTLLLSYDGVALVHNNHFFLVKKSVSVILTCMYNHGLFLDNHRLNT
jgi:hypothetical protein